MRIAFAAWHDRIAPVFDVTHRVHVVDVDAGRVVRESEVLFGDENAVGRATRLAALGIDVLVSGAISRPQQALFQAYGIAVVPFVTGRLGAVIGAWRAGRLGRDEFAMPGCGPGRGHRDRWRGREWGEEGCRRRRGSATSRRALR
jgi:predicted Fe-Mo cluster-binding NifX family protein